MLASAAQAENILGSESSSRDFLSDSQQPKGRAGSTPRLQDGRTHAEPLGDDFHIEEVFASGEEPHEGKRSDLGPTMFPRSEGTRRPPNERRSVPREPAGCFL